MNTTCKCYLNLLLFFMVSTMQSQSWTWVTSYGSTGIETSGGMTNDNQNNIYTAGTFGADLNMGGITLQLEGIEDILVSKRDTTGTIQWAVRAGSSDRDDVTGIVTDSQGDVYVAGLFWDTATFDQVTLTAGTGLTALFLAKYNSAGAVIWGSSIQGSGLKVCTTIKAGQNDHIYIAGYFSDSLFIGDSTLVGVGTNDAFFAKFDADGNLMWVRQFGYQLKTWITSIAVDTAGAVYTVGQFDGRIIFGMDTIWAESFDFDLFLAKYDTDGNFLWYKYLGGVFDDLNPQLTLDETNQLYIAGHFVGLMTLDNFQFQTTAFDTDIFVTQLSNTGQVNWAKQLGGGNNDIVETIAVHQNHLAIGGRYQTATTVNTQNFSTTFNDNNGLMIHLNTDGTFDWATEIGGTGNSTITNIISFNQDWLVHGNYVNSGSFGTTTLPNNGFSDVFIGRFHPLTTSAPSIASPSIALNIFPNPATHYFQIQYKNTAAVAVQIYNTTGQLIQNHPIVLHNATLDIHTLPRGIYFIHITDGDYQFVRRLIKY